MSKAKLIVALDVPTADEARSIVAEIGTMIGAVKIGLQLFTAAGPALVSEVAGRGHRVFLDLKFHDIPNTVAQAAAAASRLGVWMLNVHALGGSEMMRRTAEVVSDVCNKENLARPLVIGVTVLTSSDELTLRETGIGEPVESEVLRLATLAGAAGLDGVVASPLESTALRNSGLPSDFKIVTPGIRLLSATIDDQKRVTTPGAALAAGADYIVVGRPIIDAADRSIAVEKILADMQTANTGTLSRT